MNQESYISPMQAIRKNCLDCSGGQFKEVRACPVVGCPLWKFRLGINPNCGDNAINPFLQTTNFVGLKNIEASKVINLIETKQGEKNER
jgi:hypothetical protein